jgi:hypothetical protein
MRDARAKILRAVDECDHVPLGSELSGHFVYKLGAISEN